MRWKSKLWQVEIKAVYNICYQSHSKSSLQAILSVYALEKVQQSFWHLRNRETHLGRNIIL